MNDVVEVAVQPQSGYVVAGLSGQLSLQTAAVARHALVELLSNASCVVADLSGLRLRDPESVAVFSAAVQQAGGWPRAKLALFGVGPRMLAQLRWWRVAEAVPVADGLDAALAAAGRPPGAWPSGVSATDEQAIANVLGPRKGTEGWRGSSDTGLAPCSITTIYSNPSLSGPYWCIWSAVATTRKRHEASVYTAAQCAIGFSASVSSPDWTSTTPAPG